MKEDNMWNILIYLFSNQLQQDGRFEQIMEELSRHINDNDAQQAVMSRAISWLRELVNQTNAPLTAPQSASFRVLNTEEDNLLDPVCHGLLFALEQQGILTPYYRELVIGKALELCDMIADLSLIKWIALMILIQHEEDKRAIACMQFIALDDAEGGVH
ncbi:MAG: DUF494 domain-containing protein [Gammaproteobacteria bacterium]|nr:DUF494 domain-containing protein [Gammaproteobacteria bacterium]